MPIQLLGLNDHELFEYVNFVMVGWGLLVFLPGWKHTQKLSLWVAFAFCIMYIGLLFNGGQAGDMDIEAFFTLDGVIGIMKQPDAAFVCWVHFVALDLMAGRYIVADSRAAGIHHLAIVWLLPLTLMFAPLGLATYVVWKPIAQFLFGSDVNAQQIKRD